MRTGRPLPFGERAGEEEAVARLERPSPPGGKEAAAARLSARLFRGPPPSTDDWPQSGGAVPAAKGPRMPRLERD